MTPAESEPFHGEQDGLRALIGDDSWLAGRIRFWPRSTPEAITQVRFGLVFVMAWWSGPARLFWRALKQFIRELDPTARLEIVVLDIDGMTGFETTRLGATMHGAGETAWVKDGSSVIPGWALWGDDVVRVNTHLFLEGRELFVPSYLSCGVLPDAPDRPA